MMGVIVENEHHRRMFTNARRISGLILSGKRPLSTADYVALAEAFRYSDRIRIGLHLVVMAKTGPARTFALPVVVTPPPIVVPFVREVTEPARLIVHRRPDRHRNQEKTR